MRARQSHRQADSLCMAARAPVRWRRQQQHRAVIGGGETASALQKNDKRTVFSEPFGTQNRDFEHH
eukprot:6179356-Pleurochrysis_carterae.AAC.3